MNTLVGAPASLVYFGLESFYFGEAFRNANNPGALAGYGRIVGEHQRLAGQPFCSGAMK